jgi:hypothetical protein
MASSGMLRHVALVITDVSKEFSASFIRMTRIGASRLLVTANFPNSLILVTLMKEELSTSETSVLTRAMWHNIPEDAIIHSHHHENLKSYRVYFSFPCILCYYCLVSDWR